MDHEIRIPNALKPNIGQEKRKQDDAEMEGKTRQNKNINRTCLYF